VTFPQISIPRAKSSNTTKGKAMIKDGKLNTNAEIIDVVAGKRTFKKGDRGGGIASLQDALMRAEFLCMDPLGSYSSGTETAVKEFRDFYGFYFSPYKTSNSGGGVVDAEFIENLDSALQGTLTVNSGVKGTIKGSRFQAAEKCLPILRTWIDASLMSIEFGGQILQNRSLLNMQDATHINVLSAFFLHFRLSLLSESFLMPAFVPFNIPLRNVKVATLNDLKPIMNLFVQFKRKTTQTAKQIYVESPPHKTVPEAIASASTGGKLINLHPPFMPVSGRTSDSIVWISIHEMTHLFVSSPHDRNHPNATDADYMILNSAQCKSNPDSYAHFATQIVKKKPQLTPW
jgi:peptidoglycan hydrolase-like protein with peptidoglycan-binding domain